jgi:uncharacterized protein YjbJ (UPF0337 family)
LGIAPVSSFFAAYLEKAKMNKDQIAGTAKIAKGAVEELGGKASGDTRLEAAGKVDKLWGRIQRAIGGLKNTLAGK